MRKPIVFTSEHEMPPMAVSLADMGHNRTGGWRYLRPIYSEKLAPCKSACPVGNDIPRILSLVSEGHYEDAWRLFRETSPLPGVCGRVCYHPCESFCNRKNFDEALSIASIERFVADACFGLEDRISERPRRSEKIAIVGSGPAGLTCAYFLAKDGYAVTVFEAASQPGGMLRLGIPSYRLPREVLDREIELIARWGVEFRTNIRVGQEIDIEKLWEQHDAVFIATGAHRGRALNIPGEEFALQGLEFLKAVNLSPNPSPTRRGEGSQGVRLGKKVLVIGGGNTAMDCARTALRLGAQPIVVYRRTREEMPAITEEIEEAEHEGVQFEFLAAPVAIHKLNDKLEVQCIRMKLGEPDKSGRRRPVPIPGSDFILRADSVLKAVGEEPDLSFISESLETSEGIVMDRSHELLERAGVFIGGDAQTGPSTVAQAMRSGKETAQAIMRFLRGERTPKPKKLEEALRVNFAYFAHMPRVPTPQLPVSERIANFAETKRALSPEQARAEATRCFSCGVCNNCDNCWVFCPDVAITRMNGTYEVNYDFCKGCGVCVEECPRSVISLVEEEL
ncbi:MAG: NAD(P)-binding protein [Candidatus Bipolaricaulota bacterium]|nr:NAD(P)-binding protein [Candidatus Bipolaricaulota bacterium]